MGRHRVVLVESLLCVVDQVGLAVGLGLSSCVLAVVAIGATPRVLLAIGPAGALLDHAIRSTVREQGTLRVVLVPQRGHHGSTIRAADIELAYLRLGALAGASCRVIPHDNALPQVLLHGLLTWERLLVGLQRHVLAATLCKHLGWSGGCRGLCWADSGRQTDLCNVELRRAPRMFTVIHLSDGLLCRLHITLETVQSGRIPCRDLPLRLDRAYACIGCLLEWLAGGGAWLFLTAFLSVLCVGHAVSSSLDHLRQVILNDEEGGQVEVRRRLAALANNILRLAIFVELYSIADHGALVRAIVLLSVQEEVLLGASCHTRAQLGAHRGLGLRV